MIDIKGKLINPNRIDAIVPSAEGWSQVFLSGGATIQVNATPNEIEAMLP